MARPKGEEKKGGRVAGTPNKDVQGIRNAFQLLVEDNLSQLQEDLDSLKPIDRMTMIKEFAKFCIPTLKAVDFQGEIKTTQRQPIVFIKSND